MAFYADCLRAFSDGTGDWGAVLRVDLEAATADDVDAILRLREKVAAWLASRSNDLWQSPLSRQRLIRWIDGGVVFVQRDGGRVVGTVALLDRDRDVWGDDVTPAVYVHLLMIDRTHAGQKLGGRILERIETVARARGARYVRLDAGADLEELQRWYEARGYEEVATRTFTDDAETFEVTLRQKPLLPR